jgi:hypothetical protein
VCLCVCYRVSIMITLKAILHVNSGHPVDFRKINPLNAQLNPIYHLLTLLGAHPILHVSGVRVKCLKGSKHVENLYKTGSVFVASCCVQRFSLILYVFNDIS